MSKTETFRSVRKVNGKRVTVRVNRASWKTSFGGTDIYIGDSVCLLRDSGSKTARFAGLDDVEGIAEEFSRETAILAERAIHIRRQMDRRQVRK